MNARMAVRAVASLVAGRVLVGRNGPASRSLAASVNEQAVAIAASVAASRTPRRLPVLALGPDSGERLRRVLGR